MEQYFRDINDKLEKILIQTTKTNGRVDFLSEKVEAHGKSIKQLEAGDNETKGRDKVIWVILGVIGAVALLIIGSFLNG
jgi:hypothetical protein